MVQATGKKYDVEVTLNGMISVLNFIKILFIGSKITGGGSHRHNCELISLTFLFKESRLKTKKKYVCGYETYRCGYTTVLITGFRVFYFGA
jgi:hypothetical protein